MKPFIVAFLYAVILGSCSYIASAQDVDARYDSGLDQWYANLETLPRIGNDVGAASLELLYEGARVGCLSSSSGQIYQVYWTAGASGALRVTAWDEVACSGSRFAQSTNRALVDILPPPPPCPDSLAPDVVAVWDPRIGQWTVAVSTCPRTLGDLPIQSVELLYNGMRTDCVAMGNDEARVVTWDAPQDGTLTATAWPNIDCTGAVSSTTPNSSTVQLGAPQEPRFVP